MISARDRLSPADLAAAFTVVLLWGLNFTAVKYALGTWPPFWLTGMRFLAVAILLLPFFRPRREQIPAILRIAVVLGIGHFGLLFFGLSDMEAATTAIVVQLGVPFSTLLAWAVFGEKLGLSRALGMVLAFAGVALLAGEPTLPHPLPLLVAATAMLAWAISNVQVKRVGAIHPMALNGTMALFAAPMLFGLSLAVEDHQIEAMAASDWVIWACLAFTVLGSTIIAYSLWYRLLAHHPMNRIVPFTLLGPVIGGLGGVVMLGETLTWQKLVGGAITIAGVAVVQLVGGPRKTEEPGS